MLLVLLGFSVHAEDEKLLVVGSAKELNGITAKKIIWKKDGAKMVLVPEGDFLMGSNDGADDEKPMHTVYIDAFYMDSYEATNAQYQQFVRGTGHRQPAYWNNPRFNSPQQPVVGVNWFDATAYAVWAKKRLPTEAEWEKSAKGGLLGKMYPWGNSIDTSQACYDQGGNGKPSPVGSYKDNGYGLYDMAGNTWEWCADWYGEDYYSNSLAKNPIGPRTGEYRVVRGGSWYTKKHRLRVAVRDGKRPSNPDDHFGFRCVVELP